MDYPDKNGITKRQHQKQAYKQINKECVFKDDYLKNPNLYDNTIAIKHYYDLFFELFNNRKIDFQTIYYFEQVTGNKLLKWERDMMLYLSHKINAKLNELDNLKSKK